MDNGQGTLYNVHSTIENGHWIFFNGPWEIDNGQWTLDISHFTMDNGYWTSDIDYGTIEQWNGLQLQLLEFDLDTADLLVQGRRPQILNPNQLFLVP